MHTKATWSPRPMDRQLGKIRRMIKSCIQCGTCSASCPNEFAMDLTPRHLWRMVMMGCEETIFASRTFSLCSSCYQCTLRCPRGLPLTEAMAELKQLAAQRGIAAYRRSTLFYASFMESVRRHGRVREMEFMTLYFTGMRNPLLPLSFSALGVRLLSKGKVHLQVPTKGNGKLAALFHNVEEAAYALGK
jgi:heterodisulfide reductase subunit C2